MPNNRVLEIGGLQIVACSPEGEAILRGRKRFVEEYCAERGLKPFELTFAQLLEIRKQKGWKVPDAQ